MPDQPTPAAPWMAGANNGPTVPPFQFQNAEAPEEESPASAGLSGGGISAPLAPSAPQPPEPHQTVAQHILSALGGSSGEPMAWAKSILAGGLAAAANVGKVPEGAGWLAGASKGAQGLVEQQRQQALDKQKAQQQQFENAEKLKADTRAQEELANTKDRTKAEIAMYDARRVAEVHADQRAQALAPYMEAEKKAELDKIQTQQEELRRSWKTSLIEAGVDPKQLEDGTAVTNAKDAPPNAAKDIASGSILLVHNGESASVDEDKQGLHPVNDAQEFWNKKITKDMQVISGYDSKTGKPEYTTAVAGTSMSTIAALHDKANNDLAMRQKVLTDAAELKQKQAILEHMQAETELAKANMPQGPQKDILGGEFTPPPGGIKETNKVRDSFKKDADNLARTEGTYNQFQDVLNDINAGKPLTGAQSVVALFNAIGISAEPLQGKGFRINSSTVEEHANARGLGESLYQKFLKLKEGDVITPQQIKDYAEIAMRSRRDAYVNKVNEARSAGINPDFLLPRGNGRKIDTNTAQIFYDTAAGATPQEKAANAKKAAAGTGWQF